jgi:large subunit ribosomal protein L21
MVFHGIQKTVAHFNPLSGDFHPPQSDWIEKNLQKPEIGACINSVFRHFPQPYSILVISMAYAVIQTGGKQYRVESGNEIEVEKLEAEVGADIQLSEVLLVADGGKIQVGAPFVAGAKVGAKVVDQFKDDKVIAFKFRRRKGYHRTVGHRRQLTKLKIESISTK